MPFKTCLRISSLETLGITFEISPSSVVKSLTSARGALSGPWYGRNTTVTVSPVSKLTPVSASRPWSSCVSPDPRSATFPVAGRLAVLLFAYSWIASNFDIACSLYYVHINNNTYKSSEQDLHARLPAHHNALTALF